MEKRQRLPHHLSRIFEIWEIGIQMLPKFEHSVFENNGDKQQILNKMRLAIQHFRNIKTC